MCAIAGSLVLGCGSTRPPLVTIPIIELASLPERACAECSSELDSEFSRAVELRLADLKLRGGSCSALAAVMESSYRNGQVILRPYMWRVGPLLASGEAKPNGEMILAREIDSLNIGVRTVRDVVSSMEHEAAHIAFRITNGVDAAQDRANSYVRACK